MKKTKVLLVVLTLSLVIGGMTYFGNKSLVAIDPPNQKPLNVIIHKIVAIDPPNQGIMIDPPNQKPSI